MDADRNLRGDLQRDLDVFIGKITAISGVKIKEANDLTICAQRHHQNRADSLPV